MAPTKKFASPPSQASCGILPSNQHYSDPNTSLATALSGEIYQVDYTCVNAGKTIGATKRRIRWRFGFADPEAIQKGLVGPLCRGEEHEVIFNWSLKSGKQVVLADGNEVIVECRPYESTFEYSWRMRGHHEVKVKGSVKPTFSQGTRQFDLWIDGRSFFQFHQIYELGRKPPSLIRHSRYSPQEFAHDQVEAYRSTRSMNRTKMNVQVRVPESEKVDWPKSNFHHDSTPSTVDTNQSDSFDFRSVSTGTISPMKSTDFLSAPPPPTLDQVLESQRYNHQSCGDQALPVAAAPVYNAELEKQYRHNVMSHQVMQEYRYTPTVVTPSAVADPSTHNTFPSQTAEANEEIYEEEVQKFEGEQIYIAPRLTSVEIVPSPNNDVSDMLKKLCNLDDITSDPHKETKLTLIPTTKQSQTSNRNKKNSTPMPPVSPNYYGPEPSLNEMKEFSSSKVMSSTTQNVMKQQPIYAPHPSQGDVSQNHIPGALVVYGVSQAHGGAPPLQKVTGFGVGAQTGQGYGNYTVHHGVYANM